jgi:hypothetical protein
MRANMTEPHVVDDKAAYTYDHPASVRPEDAVLVITTAIQAVGGVILQGFDLNEQSAKGDPGYVEADLRVQLSDGRRVWVSIECPSDAAEGVVSTAVEAIEPGAKVVLEDGPEDVVVDNEPWEDSHRLLQLRTLGSRRYRVGHRLCVRPPSDTDQAKLDQVLRLVHEYVPMATEVRLSTSDQGYRGFWLEDVVFVDGSALATTDPDALEQLRDDLFALLSELAWDSAVGEDEHGQATVPIPEV